MQGALCIGRPWLVQERGDAAGQSMCAVFMRRPGLDLTRRCAVPHGVRGHGGVAGVLRCGAWARQTGAAHRNVRITPPPPQATTSAVGPVCIVFHSPSSVKYCACEWVPSRGPWEWWGARGWTAGRTRGGVGHPGLTHTAKRPGRWWTTAERRCLGRPTTPATTGTTPNTPTTGHR